MLGKESWLKQQGIDLIDTPEHFGPIVWFVKNKECQGCLLLADTLREESKQVIEDLRKAGVEHITMLTGDRKVVAEQVGRELELDRVIAEALPKDKLNAIGEAKQGSGKVMVVGDGINDALALASGDVGIAMGAMGSDIAIQSADVALMVNDLGRVVDAMLLSRATREAIHQNILVGAGVSVSMLALAAYGYISPLAGALLHLSLIHI